MYYIYNDITIHQKKFIDPNSILLLGVSLYGYFMMSRHILNLYKAEFVMTDGDTESLFAEDFIAHFNIFRTVLLAPKYVILPILPYSVPSVASHSEPRT
jgi:hypothetical protein